MTKNMLILTAFILISFGLKAQESSQADYSKCSQFLNQGPMGGFYGSGLSQIAPGASYLPFKLEPNGQIKPHSDVHSFSSDPETGETVIEYQVPSLENGYLKSEGQNPYIQKTKLAKVVIKKNDQGHIESIVNDLNLSQKELSHYEQLSKQGFPRPEQELSEEEKKNIEQWLPKKDGKPYHPIYTYKQTKIQFEMKNGSCVPSEVSNTALTQPFVDGDTHTTTGFKLQLCKDIQDFLERNPQAEACFKKDLNDEMNSIFSRHLSLEDASPKTGSFGGGYPGGGMGGYHSGGFYTPSLEAKVAPFNGPFMENASKAVKENFQKRSGQSEIITAHSILQQCKSVHKAVDEILTDESVWAETSSEASAQSSASAVTEQ